MPYLFNNAISTDLHLIILKFSTAEEQALNKSIDKRWKLIQEKIDQLRARLSLCAIQNEEVINEQLMNTQDSSHETNITGKQKFELVISKMLTNNSFLTRPAKIFKICRNITFYLLNNFKEIQNDYNETLTLLKDEEALRRKKTGLNIACYGYNVNLELSEKISSEIEEIEKNEYCTKEQKDFDEEWGAGPEDSNVARNIIEKYSLLGLEKVIEMKIRGLAHGDLGFGYEPENAKKLNEELIKSGNRQALERKILGLLNGDFGYSKNPHEANTLNEQLLEKGDIKAIERKIKNLFEDKNHYQKNSELAVDIIKKSRNTILFNYMTVIGGHYNLWEIGCTNEKIREIIVHNTLSL